MTFTQYQNRRDLEDSIDWSSGKFFFVTADHRTYSKMEIADEGGYYEVNAETFSRLFELQSCLEFMTEGVEIDFRKMKKEAEDLETTFKKALEAVKFKPIRRVR